MSLQILKDRIQTLVGTESNLNAAIKFKTDQGVIFVDTRQNPVLISDEDQEAACTFEISVDNTLKLLDGQLNPMTAMMLGKLKVKGDMGIAMKIAQTFGNA